MSLIANMFKQKSIVLLLLTLFCAPLSVWAGDESVAPTEFAVVDGEAISLKEFQSAFQAGIRKRFYHGKIPKEQMDAFRQEVSQALIDRVLLIQEAKKQNIKADETIVARQLAEYEKRYQGRPFWQQHKNEMMSGLRAALEEENMLQLLEEKIRNVQLPDDAAAKQYYAKNTELFTTPEKLRVSVILLKVSPASPASVWEAANEEAKDLIARLKNGADFSELARIHSGDETASKGGDMGFIHKGMLAKPAQAALDKLQVGEISEPVMLLRGVGIFQLHKKQSPSLNEYGEVAERAKQLLQRENAKLAWSDLLEKLRAQADIKINTAALTIIDKS